MLNIGLDLLYGIIRFACFAVVVIIGIYAGKKYRDYKDAKEQ